MRLFQGVDVQLNAPVPALVLGSLNSLFLMHLV